jgi:L,D-peptidoglycan transpeptidase YkuD (ErfK/YbiS/YcfS/YnhG family)
MYHSCHNRHMAVARILSSCAVVVAVAGCTAVAIGMGRAASAPEAAVTPYSVPTMTTPSDQPVATPIPRRAVPPPQPAPAKTTPAKAHVVVPQVAAPPATRASVRTTVKSASKPRSTPVPKAVPKAAPKPVATRGQRLPVAGSTAGATRVITVTASSYGSTIATLQPWVAAPGGGWLKHGGAILAHVGADGLSTAPSETRSATPVGSFSLTQAFGAYSDPGTALPYFRTNAADWWISQPGALYNTHQHCGSGCGFTHGAPNEHLAYELPYYRYAVVIDYNTRNAPGGVRQGRGSAFFLHVTDGYATAGCVAISQAQLVSIMKWLTPSAHPRILIGVA